MLIGTELSNLNYVMVQALKASLFEGIERLLPFIKGVNS